MKNKKIGLGILVMVFIMTAAGCNNGSTGGGSSAPPANTEPKTIVITGINGSSFTSGGLGIYPVGTNINIEDINEGLVAGANANNADKIVTNDSVTYPLYNSTSTNRWTGNGTFDVYFLYKEGTGTPEPYKAGSVSFSSATTTVAFSRFTKVTLP